MRRACWVLIVGCLAAVLGFSSAIAVLGTGRAEAVTTDCLDLDVLDFSGSGSVQDIRDDDDEVVQPNYWTFGGGRDIGWAQGCDDPFIGGGDDNDQLHAGSGNDVVSGNANNDDIWGGASDTVNLGDNLAGFAGADDLDDEQQFDLDIVDGGSGPDSIGVLDSDDLDDIDGGSESDSCSYDAGDARTSC